MEEELTFLERLISVFNGIDIHQKSPDLWQLLRGGQPCNGPSFSYKNLDHRATYGRSRLLEFGAKDWNDVIDRGFTWGELWSFVYRWECVSFGPFWISRFQIEAANVELRPCLLLGGLYFSMDKSSPNDDGAKLLFSPFLKLFSFYQGPTTCSICRDSAWWLSVIMDHNGLELDGFAIAKHKYIEADTLHSIAAKTKDLKLIRCCIMPTRKTLYTAPSDHSKTNRMQILSITNTHVEAWLLMSFIEACTSMKSLNLVDLRCHKNKRYFSTEQWIALMQACAKCERLEVVHVDDLHIEASAWLPGLLILIHTESILSIEYTMRSLGLPNDIQVVRTVFGASRSNTIVQAVNRNKHLIHLRVHYSCVDEATFKSNVYPLLDRNIFWKHVQAFFRELTDEKSSMKTLDRLLCHRMIRQDPSLLFELICKTSDQLLHKWHDGRQQRIMKTGKRIEEAEANLIQWKKDFAEYNEYAKIYKQTT